MIFCNIDHIAPNLLPKTQEASAHFFAANVPLMELFRQLELGSGQTGNLSLPRESVSVFQALSAAHSAERQFLETAKLLTNLAEEVEQRNAHINDEIKRSNVFADAAREVKLSPNSEMVRGVIADILRSGIESVVKDCAARVIGLAQRLGTIGARIQETKTFQDRDYADAHTLISDWSALLHIGQFVSSICFMAARVAG